jgi:hypothetical protein
VLQRNYRTVRVSYFEKKSSKMQQRRKLLLTAGIVVIATALLFCLVSTSPDNAEARRRRLSEEKTNEDEVRKVLEMFEHSDFTVIGPSSFPKPSAKAHPDAVPAFQPTFGQHRPDQDAVMAFAAEYGLNTYLTFVTTLRNTGFTGDIVFAVSKLDVERKGVKEYFESQPGLVVYVISLDCFNAEGDSVDSIKGGMRVCQLHGLWQHADGEIMQDPRPSRTVATTRYELYWIWALNYNRHSWLMLLDARDSFFQTNPFLNVKREKVKDRPDGILYFFGVSSFLFVCVCVGGCRRCTRAAVSFPRLISPHLTTLYLSSVFF